jgi:hypothetical protein
VNFSAIGAIDHRDMGARMGKNRTDYNLKARSLNRATALLNVLENHVKGKRKLSMSQIRTLPDIKAPGVVGVPANPIFSHGRQLNVVW